MNQSSGRAVLVFAATSMPQPWPCYFCGDEIEIKLKTRGCGSHGRNACLHHIDGDHENNDPANWAWAHNSCHVSFHVRGSKRSQRHRQRIADSLRKPKTAEHRANIAAGASRQQRETRITCVCGTVSTPQALGRYHKACGSAAIGDAARFENE